MLYNSEGTELAYEQTIEANIETSSLANIFYGAVLNRTQIENPADVGEHNFKLSFARNESAEQFLCYFTDSFKTSYLKDNNGTFFCKTSGMA